MKLAAVDLFSGIGGMAQAVRDAGFELAALCEIEPMCRRILEKNFPGTPILEDIHDVSIPLTEGDESLALLTGAFPLQANFTRGERRERDTRSLWEQFVRIVGEARPAWAVVETLPRFSTMGLDDAAWDLERAGYATVAIHLPAQAVGCPLRKDRIYLVAARSEDPRPAPAIGPGDGDPPPSWPAPGPELHRVAQRPGRDLDEHVALLHAIGDATVPLQAGAILGSIAAYEREWRLGSSATRTSRPSTSSSTASVRPARTARASRSRNFGSASRRPTPGFR